MKKLFSILLCVFISQTTFATGIHYEMRVDGLACPYCAYGVEKQLKSIKGVDEVQVDLAKGIVNAKVSKGTTLTEDQMEKLFKDAGFTFRGMKTISTETNKQNGTDLK